MLKPEFQNQELIQYLRQKFYEKYQQELIFFNFETAKEINYKKLVKL